jgi:hypothetical protein
MILAVETGIAAKPNSFVCFGYSLSDRIVPYMFSESNVNLNDDEIDRYEDICPSFYLYFFKMTYTTLDSI